MKYFSGPERARGPIQYAEENISFVSQLTLIFIKFE
jgi:hypothetical protein